MSQDSQIYKRLKLFKTTPHPCSYIPGEEASTLFVDPEQEIDLETYTFLSERGYRRSGDYMYRPDCLSCQACISLRIPIAKYRFSRNDKRLINRNQDLTVRSIDSITEDESFYRLYEAYINQRHQDGDMYPANQQQYSSFLNNPYGSTEYQGFYLDDELLALAVIDRLENGLSAVYTFYHPDSSYDKRSLGTYAILWQLQEAKQRELDYVYLGYWVKQCRKMNYKTRFRPAEILINQRWLTLL